MAKKKKNKPLDPFEIFTRISTVLSYLKKTAKAGKKGDMKNLLIRVLPEYTADIMLIDFNLPLLPQLQEKVPMDDPVFKMIVSCVIAADQPQEQTDIASVISQGLSSIIEDLPKSFDISRICSSDNPVDETLNTFADSFTSKELGMIRLALDQIL